jgi:hypothetical protein
MMETTESIVPFVMRRFAAKSGVTENITATSAFHRAGLEGAKRASTAPGSKKHLLLYYFSQMKFV